MPKQSDFMATFCWLPPHITRHKKKKTDTDGADVKNASTTNMPCPPKCTEKDNARIGYCTERKERKEIFSKKP